MIGKQNKLRDLKGKLIKMQCDKHSTLVTTNDGVTYLDVSYDPDCERCSKHYHNTWRNAELGED